MSRLLSVVVALVLLAATIAFSVINAHPVVINYYVGSTEMPLALLVVICLIVGVLVGFLLALGWVLRLRMELLRTRRRLKTAQKEVDNLRTLPVKDEQGQDKVAP